MSTNPLPELVERFHLYTKDVGRLLHRPFDTLNVWPDLAIPVIAGALTNTGARSITRDDAVDEEYEVVPPEFTAATVALTKYPTSPASTTYVWLLAPTISVYVPSEVLERVH